MKTKYILSTLFRGLKNSIFVIRSSVFVIRNSIFVILITIFTITIFAMIITSCNKKETINPPNMIKFWHFWSEPNQKQALLELISTFEKENDCKVELTELSWNDGKTKLIAAFNSDVAPDVLELGSDWLAQFSSSEVLAEISPDVVDYSIFLEYCIPPVLWNNKYYAVPWIVDTRVLFFNKKLMTDNKILSVPTTYKELIDYSNQINNSQKGIYGFGANGSDPHRLYKKILPIIWTVGGDILDSTGYPIINSNKNIEALHIYLQLSRIGLIETQKQIDSYFTQGKIGFIFSGAWLLEKINNENPKLEFGVALMPKYNEREGISYLGCEYLALSKNSDKKELGMKLIKFLSSGANSLILAKKFAEAGFPSEKKYFNDTFFMNNPYKSIFAEQLHYAKSTPVNERWLDIEAILENAVSQAIYGEKSPDAALNDAQLAILKLLME